MKVTVPDSVTCSQCGGVFRVFQIPWPYTGEMHLVRVNHCPICGAVVKGDKK